MHPAPQRPAQSGFFEKINKKLKHKEVCNGSDLYRVIPTLIAKDFNPNETRRILETQVDVVLDMILNVCETLHQAVQVNQVGVEQSDM